MICKKNYLIAIIWTNIVMSFLLLEGMISFHIIIFIFIENKQRCFLKSVEYDVQAITMLQHHNICILLYLTHTFLTEQMCPLQSKNDRSPFLQFQFNLIMINCAALVMS